MIKIFFSFTAPDSLVTWKIAINPAENTEIVDILTIKQSYFTFENTAHPEFEASVARFMETKACHF